MQQSRATYKAHSKQYSAASARRGFKSTYGITIEEKEAMFEAQGRKCACCGSAEPGDIRGWHLDHDHETGKNRAVICNPCNLTLGHCDEDTQRLQACIVYLKKHTPATLVLPGVRVVLDGSVVDVQTNGVPVEIVNAGGTVNG